MSKIKNNLVEIAEVLIEMKEERELNGVPEFIMNRYPEDSVGIVINDDNYIVINKEESEAASEDTKVNALKDESIKYNGNFYYSTHESDEPDIIDETHNKSKLISEAYTEVSFLPKNIYSEAEFNNDEQEKARACVNTIIDKNSLCSADFTSYKLAKIENKYSREYVYDEIYRCRCLFVDISGNESIKSLLIKAYKVSNKKDAEYTYQVIDNDNIRELVENLENIVKQDKTRTMRQEYAVLSTEELEAIKEHIKDGIEHYYEENSHRFYRLTRVDVKAIYCLRLQKIPMQIIFREEDKDIASHNTFYSPIAREFNVFTCPNCGETSSDEYDGIKFHVDHDISVTEDVEGYVEHAIGCSHCMDQCQRCGAWHFKVENLKPVLENNYLMPNRKFLRHYVGSNFKAEELCSCKEYLNWIYDELSPKIELSDSDAYCYSEIIDSFMSSSCKLVFINDLTGEVIASNEDFMRYVHESILVYLTKSSKGFGLNGDKKVLADKFKIVLKQYKEMSHKKDVKAFLRNFIDSYIINEDGAFDGIQIQACIKQALIDFKRKIADALNIFEEYIKVTSSKRTATCSCCGSQYVVSESSYNQVKGMCTCCALATGDGLRMWVRVDDDVTFFRPKKRVNTPNTGKKKPKNNDNKTPDATTDVASVETEEASYSGNDIEEKATKIYQSKQGEVFYEQWLRDTIDSIIRNVDKN